MKFVTLLIGTLLTLILDPISGSIVRRSAAQEGYEYEPPQNPYEDEGTLISPPIYSVPEPEIPFDEQQTFVNSVEVVPNDPIEEVYETPRPHIRRGHLKILKAERPACDNLETLQETFDRLHQNRPTPRRPEHPDSFVTDFNPHDEEESNSEELISKINQLLDEEDEPLD